MHAEEKGRRGKDGSGGKGFGGPKGPKVSGFARAKQENPEQFPQMQAVFTCNRCEARQSKIFSRLAYEQGVVVVKCEVRCVREFRHQGLHCRDLTLRPSLPRMQH